MNVTRLLFIFCPASPVELFSQDFEVRETGPDDEVRALFRPGNTELVPHDERYPDLAVDRKHHVLRFAPQIDRHLAVSGGAIKGVDSANDPADIDWGNHRRRATAEVDTVGDPGCGSTGLNFFEQTADEGLAKL